MNLQIANGVKLRFFSTKKFKTTTVMVNLINSFDYKVSAKRALVARMMENANADFPDQQAIANHLAWMNGADFDSDIFRYGNLSILRLTLTLPSSNVLMNNSSLVMGLEFLKSVLFSPLAKNRKIDQDTLDLQKINLIRYLESILDDKETYVTQQLKKLYYKDNKNLSSGDAGTIEEVKTASAEDVYQTYQDLIRGSDVEIIVLGNADADIIQQQVQKWPFVNRTLPSFSVKVPPVEHKMIKKIEYQQIQQTKISLAYQFPIYYDDARFFAAILLNALLGGSSQSKLFKNVREKNHLAYYADSIYESFKGLLYIQAGVNQSQYCQAIELIFKQVADIQKGDFSEQNLDRIKKQIIRAKISLQDSSHQLTLEKLDHVIVHRDLSDEEWCAKLNQVKKADIIKIANLLDLKAQFTLMGE